LEGTVRNRHVGGAVSATALAILLIPVALARPSAADEPTTSDGCAGMTEVEENHSSIRFRVDEPASNAEVAVDEHGRITVLGILHKQATMVDVADERVTSSDFSLGPPPDGVAAWASSWTTSLRPPHLGANQLCTRAKRDPKRTARILRSFTVVDLIPPSAVPDLAVSNITATTAKVTWGEATDNYGVAGYIVTVDGGAPQRTTVGVRSYTITGLAPSTTHTVSVVAIDLAGNTSATPSTASFTTAAAPPPPSSDLTFVPDQGTATAAWHPDLSTDVTYRALLDGQLIDEFPLDEFCQDAEGNPAEPCTAQSVIRYTVESLEENTPYTFQFESLRADGAPARSLSGSFTTTTGPEVVPRAVTQLIASEGSRCAGMGGDLYVAASSRVRVSIPAGSTQLFEGCHTVPDSRCIDAFLPPSGAKIINCADDITRLIRSLAPPGHGPISSSLRGVPDYLAGPGPDIVTQPVTWCTEEPVHCVELVAAAAETAKLVLVEAAAAEAGASVLVVFGPAILAGIAIGIPLGVLLALVWGTPIGVASFSEYPIHYNDNFDTFDNWGLDEGTWVNDLALYTEIIKTTNQLARKWNIPHAWNPGLDTDLHDVIDSACSIQAGDLMRSGVCGNGFAVYVPGAVNYRFAPMPQTGNHIVTAMGNGRSPQPPVRRQWYYPAYSRRGQAAASRGYSRRWFNTQAFQPNPCVPRPKGVVCDEFPFWATNQAVDLSSTSTTRVVASLQQVPRSEASPQGSDYSQFLSKCGVNDTDRFMVLPLKSWVAANGPSFGFRVQPGGTSPCMVPVRP
jgi:hypothetical protein